MENYNDITIQDIMKYNTFCVVGDVLNEEKYAYKIVCTLKSNNYNVIALARGMDINNYEFDVLNLCLNPVKGLEIIKSYNKHINVVLLQPNSYDDNLINYLEKQKIAYLKGCSLIGCSLL